jgi:hypothetical protein
MTNAWVFINAPSMFLEIAAIPFANSGQSPHPGSLEMHESRVPSSVVQDMIYDVNCVNFEYTVRICRTRFVLLLLLLVSVWDKINNYRWIGWCVALLEERRYFSKIDDGGFSGLLLYDWRNVKVLV